MALRDSVLLIRDYENIRQILRDIYIYGCFTRDDFIEMGISGRKPRKYTDEFKQQLVELYRSGKRRCDICREYDIATSLFDKWVKQASNSGSFHEKDNRTPEQEELIRLRKENQQLRMENDILKQAALILGRK